MKRSLLAALVALAVLVFMPTSTITQAQTDGGKTLVDAVVKVAPGEDSGFCMGVENDGTMHVSLQTTDGRDDDSLGPPKFMLAPYRTSPPGPNAPPEVWDQPVTASKTNVELAVVRRLYCFNLTLPTTPEVSVLPSRERAERFRYVALKLTLTPQ